MLCSQSQWRTIYKKKKNHPKFCGTHVKGTPHGEITQTEAPKTHTKKTCWAQKKSKVLFIILMMMEMYMTLMIYLEKLLIQGL